ncbi:MAG TPA: hypothetical protein VGO57_06830 [Verrucomicrobiae bacterium]|jgi:hypothetical protein
MLHLRLILGCCLLGLLAGRQVAAQPVYYNTSSAAQPLSALASVSTNGGGNSTLYTAASPVGRCTALAVDALNHKLFFVDGTANSLWSVSLTGTGLTLVKSGLTSYPTDLALDVLNQKIYFTTSSATQNNNTIQRVDYTGSNNVTLFTATGTPGNGVSRCTALAVDLVNSKMFIADVGTQKIWSLTLAGGGLTTLVSIANSYPFSLALDVTNQLVYFTTSSFVQTLNQVQRINYNGTGLTTLFTASGSVQRCTAIDLNLASATIYLADAGNGTSSLWKLSLTGGTATSLLSGLPATAKKVRWFSGPDTRPPPTVTGIQITGTNVQLNATNGYVGGTYYILTNTNLGAPLNQWLPILTNVLSSSGSFSVIATNSVDHSIPGRFFVLQVE